MSECVVRMEIPVNCDKCDLRNGCKLYVDYSWSLSDCFPTRPKPNPLDKGCLIICSLPEGHGRLIDADAIIEVMKKCAENPENGQALLCYRYVQRILEEALTIVPAERREE